MSDKNLSRVNPQIVQTHPGLPTVPDAFMRADYEGWLEERVKRFQLRTYQKTQAERIKVLHQINELQKECLALARNEKEWGRFDQHERMRQKRLDLEEMQLDDQIETFLMQRAARVTDRQRGPQPSSRSKRSALADQFQDRLRQALDLHNVAQKGREEIERLKAKHPELADELEQTFLTILSDMRENL